MNEGSINKVTIASQLQQQGFSLLELMVITTILGILMSVALPAFEAYSDRARFAELVSATGAYRIAIVRAAEAGLFESVDEMDEGTRGIPEQVRTSATEHGIHVHNGVIKAEWRRDGSSLEKVRFELSAQNHEPPIIWQAGGSCIEKGYC